MAVAARGGDDAKTAEMYTAGILAGLPQWLAFDCKLSLRNIVCLSQYGPAVETEPDEVSAALLDLCFFPRGLARLRFKQIAEQSELVPLLWCLAPVLLTLRLCKMSHARHSGCARACVSV